MIASSFVFPQLFLSLSTAVLSPIRNMYFLQFAMISSSGQWTAVPIPLHMLILTASIFFL